MIITVIIPVYNVQKFLHRCIDSVVKYATSNVEIIVVDDGSTDNSGVICRKYNNKYNNVILIRKENGGLSSARNRALDKATGDYICFLDSDDFLHKDFFTDMFRIIEKYNPDIIDFKYAKEEKLNKYRLKGNKKIIEETRLEYITKLISNKIGNQICFRLYKRSLFENNKFPENQFYEDIAIFWKLVMRATKIVEIDYSYYIYNLTNQSSITKKSDLIHMLDMKKSVDQMYKGLYDYACINGIQKYLEYEKLNKYIYIGYKIRNDKEAIQLRNAINLYVKHQHINLFIYIKYDWKKYFVYKLIMFIKSMRNENER